MDVLRQAAHTLEIEANAATDNPLVLSEAGLIVSGGNFHAEPVGFAADMIALAVSEIGAIAQRRVALMVDPTLNHDLPAFLTPAPGLNSGLMIAEVTTAALMSENKHLATPTVTDSTPTSANQEDHVSMAAHGARRLTSMVENLNTILGVEAIAAAHEEGARVTAHCFGEESLADFAAAGTDCIEHATGLVPETISTFAERGIAIVPTLVNIETFPQIAAPAADKFPDYARHMLQLHERRFETIAAAHDAGVPIYVGTDAGGSLPHGLVAQEMELLVRAGFSTQEALAAGTWSSRTWLGRPAIAEGEDADLVVLAEDPREDVRACGAPEHVILRGRRVGGR
jgi:hypothetical protein